MARGRIPAEKKEADVARKIMLILMSVALMALLAGCNGGDKRETPATAADQAGSPSAETAAAAVPTGWTGEITETMDSGGYTYIQLDTGTEKIWAAATQTKVAVGQRVSVPQGMLMQDFQSTTLNRTFPEIYFVSGFYPEGQMPIAQMAKPSGGMVGMTGSASPNDGAMGGGGAAHNTVPDAEVSGVEKVSGGYDIAEIYAQKAGLDGKTVKVRGRVIKFTPRVMGTNWIHIQDGSGHGETADLTVTSSVEVQAGDLVVISGAVAVDKDFGAGYKYSVIVENATVTKE